MAIEYTSDDDFRAPAAMTCAELEASVRARLQQNDGWDAELVEDLRLFILVRHYQGQLPAEIVEELATAGPADQLVTQRDYLAKLVVATFRNGSFDEMEVQTEWHVGGGAKAVFRNPVYDHAAKAAERAGKLHDKALRMARGDGERYDPALAFSTKGNANDHLEANARSQRKYALLAAAVAAFVAGVVLIIKLAR